MLRTWIFNITLCSITGYPLYVWNLFWNCLIELHWDTAAPYDLMGGWWIDSYQYILLYHYLNLNHFAPRALSSPVTQTTLPKETGSWEIQCVCYDLLWRLSFTIDWAGSSAFAGATKFSCPWMSPSVWLWFDKFPCVIMAVGVST